MIVLRHEGRLLGWLPGIGGPAAFLDLESSSPTDGVRNLHFILFGKAPEQTEWTMADATNPDVAAWLAAAISSRGILTYEQIIRPPTWLRRAAILEERDRRQRLARIPARVRRSSAT